jgi:BlaI family transcriptional regulator, penicillinase repressor
MDTHHDNVTDAELAVLKELWKSGPATIRDLTDTLYPTGGTSLYATVQKLLDRLETKGWVKRAKDGRANVFQAAREREALLAHHLREAAEKLCEGSMTPLLSTLVSAKGLSKEDIQHLRRQLDELEKDAREN